jgi:2-polyprenyl-6-methoxyphenol hydroxylase-like FAD-dependent oxidoreductase
MAATSSPATTAAIHIAGAGIAGTAVALALHDAGADVVLHEANPHGAADAGAFLTLAENGMRALGRLGADAAVRAVSTPLRRMRLSTGDGTTLADRPLGDGDGPGYRYLTRARLCTALHGEARRRGIPIRHGRRLVGADTAPGQVTAVFADGSRARGDVLIGADGLHSRLRTLIDPDAAPPRYVGRRVFYGYSDHPGPVVSGDMMRDQPASDTIRFVRGDAAFGSITTAREGTWWFAREAGEELDRVQQAGDTSRWREHLASVLRDCPEPAAVVAASSQVLVVNAYDLAHVRAWHRDRMIVMGDAAHAASPATGQGASMALEDAVALATALAPASGPAPDPAVAFAAYERERRERVEANTAASARM